MSYRLINPRWEIVGFDRLHTVLRMPKDRQWFYVGRMTGNPTELACRCGFKPLCRATSLSDELTTVIQSVYIEHFFEMAVKGKSGVIHFLRFQVGQCSKCERIYWGMVGRSACREDEYGMTWTISVPIVDPVLQYKRNWRD